MVSEKLGGKMRASHKGAKNLFDSEDPIRQVIK